MSVNCNRLFICFDKFEYIFELQNANFDSVVEMLLTNYICMFKIINPIRTIMSSLLSSPVSTILYDQNYIHVPVILVIIKKYHGIAW